MLFYIIYISNMHENDCDSLEKSVKKDITEGVIKFVPIQKSLEVNQKEVQEKDSKGVKETSLEENPLDLIK